MISNALNQNKMLRGTDLVPGEAVGDNATASPAIVNGLLFPILFISGTFFPVDSGSWLARIALTRSSPGALRRVRTSSRR